MIQDKNKGIASITYNHLNLPRLITFDNGNTITYFYDATGVKLQKTVTESGQPSKTTAYVGGIVYEDNVRKFMSTEEGRIVLETSTPEYQYHMKDHLGNVRLTFTTASSAQQTSTYMATMEPEAMTLETATFNNIETTRQEDKIYNHTPGGKASARLNAAEDRVMGPSMTLQVMPGDTVRMQVQAKYFKKAGTKDPVAGMAGIVAASLTGGAVSEAPQIAQGIQETLGIGQAGLASKDNSIPKAYINYLFFDKENSFKKGGFKQVSEAALGSFEELTLEYIPEEEGTMMIYTANQTAEDLNVYMDDMMVMHTEGPIIRVDDYYPFGMTFNTSERTGYLTNKYLYNGKELQDELSLNTYDFGWRQYDPAIARWNVVDPLANKRFSLTPYNYVQNNPLNRFDPDGLTDYTLDKKTGEMKEVKYDDEAKQKANVESKTDRIVKTNGKGEIKYRKNGNARTAVGNVEKGILKDGINFQKDHNTIAVEGEGQPTLQGVRDFALKLSNHIDKEISGQYLSTKGSTSTNYVAFGPYANNDSQNARSGLFLDPSLLGKVNVTTDWHTHLSRFGDSDRLIPSGLSLPGGDIQYKKNQSQYNPSLRFIIITNPSSTDQKATEIEY